VDQSFPSLPFPSQLVQKVEELEEAKKLVLSKGRERNGTAVRRTSQGGKSQDKKEAASWKSETESSEEDIPTVSRAENRIPKTKKNSQAGIRISRSTSLDRLSEESSLEESSEALPSATRNDEGFFSDEMVASSDSEEESWDPIENEEAFLKEIDNLELLALRKTLSDFVQEKHAGILFFPPLMSSLPSEFLSSIPSENFSCST